MRRGIPVSPGVVVGTAYCIDQVFAPTSSDRLDDAEVASELARYQAARHRVAVELHALQQKVSRQVGPEEAAIFAMHESIVRDVAFTDRVEQWITEDRMPASSALGRLLEEYTRLFDRTTDEYLRERVNDLRDVVVRLSAHVSDVLHPSDGPPLPRPLVLVADELLPSQAVALGDLEVEGIVTQAGSQTSHAAIIARSRGIPAVCGVPSVLAHVQTGDLLVVDGRDGTVIVNPDAETAAAYRKIEREYLHLRDELASNRESPAVTADGIPLQLLANINNVSDAKAAEAMGASGVGLFRTEYLYLTHPSIPGEQEQLEVYQAVVDDSPNRSVTIRTLDIGGDKTVPYLGGRHREANPFMGWRSIRLSFEHPDFFSTQIRAILAAAAYAEKKGGQVRILFPMICNLEEIHRLRAMVRRARRDLHERGIQVPPTPIGMMLEVPAAAVSIDTMLPFVDFVSIGSNDLVQYLMAADRDNPKVSHLCQPLAPAVLRVLHQVITACLESNTPVTLCGEMAGHPRAFLLLLGMGLRSFSMSPALIPSIKSLATQLEIPQARAICQHAMRLKTTGHVRRYLRGKLQEIAPDMSLMEIE